MLTRPNQVVTVVQGCNSWPSVWKEDGLKITRRCERPDVVSDTLLPLSYEESKMLEAKRLLGELESKREAHKQAVRESLNHVSQVKQIEGETVYANLFGMIVKDCVDRF